MKRLVPLSFCIFLATCGQNVTPGKPVSKADIAAAEISLTSAIRLANVCLIAAAGPCATGAPLRAQLIADIHKADAAFLKVQADNNAGLPVSLTAMDLAISEITSETPATR